MSVNEEEAKKAGYEVEPKTGRWFRRTKHGIEYEMFLNGVPEHLFRSSQKRQKELDAKRLEEARRKAEEDAARTRFCPFHDGVSRMCILDQCALYGANGCDLAPRTNATRDTSGKNCPLTKVWTACRADCVMYRSGCVLTTKEV